MLIIEADRNITKNAIVTFTSFIMKRGLIRNEAGVPVNVSIEEIHLDVVRCDQADTRFDFIKNNPNLVGVLNQTFCFAPKTSDEQFYLLEGNPLEQFESVYNIEIWPCSLENRSLCADSDKLKVVDLLLIHPLPSIDYSKVEDYLTWIAGAGTRIKIDLNSRQLYSLEMKTVSLLKDNAFISSPKEEGAFMDVESRTVSKVHRDRLQMWCGAEMVGNDMECEPYVSVRVYSSNKQKVITRVYPNVVQALSEVGGFRELVLMVLGMVYLVYDWIFDDFRRFLLDLVFGVGHSRKAFGEQVGLVEGSLDIVELIKELNGLKIVNRVVFQDHHIALISEVLAKIKQQESKERHKNPSSNLREDQYVSTLKRKNPKINYH